MWDNIHDYKRQNENNRHIVNLRKLDKVYGNFNYLNK